MVNNVKIGENKDRLWMCGCGSGSGGLGGVTTGALFACNLMERNPTEYDLWTLIVGDWCWIPRFHRHVTTNN